MDWDFRSEFNMDRLKAAKDWFSPLYYLYPAIPLLAGTFYGAGEGGLKVMALILLAVVVIAGRTLVSVLASLKEARGEVITYYPGIFQGISLPLSTSVLTFIGAVSGVVVAVFGLILCVAYGFGLLTFGVLAAAVAALFILGYSQTRPCLPPVLAFFGQGFVITAAAYYCQTGVFTSAALGISLPLGFMAAALALSSHVDFGVERDQAKIYALIFAAYGFVVINLLYGVWGLWPLLVFALIPLLKKDMSTGNFSSFYLKFGLGYCLCLLLSLTF